MPRQERNRRKKKMEEREPSLRIGKVLTLLVPLAVVVVIVMNVQNWAKFIGDHYSFVLGGLGIFAAGMVAAKLLLEPSADGPGGRFAQILALADKWKHDSLQRENRELKEENRRLTKAAGKQKKADERAERAAAANAKAAKRVPELESRVRELTEKTGKLESELAETKTALAGAQSERYRNHEQVSALQTRLGELGNELGAS